MNPIDKFTNIDAVYPITDAKEEDTLLDYVWELAMLIHPAIPKKVKGNIGLIIKGYFNAPQDDIYTFALLSDDGSTLTIDSEQIVDNDGPHGPKEIVGQKALAKGYHPMELRYFDQNGGQLKLKVTGSDGKEIPFTHLYAH